MDQFQQEKNQNNMFSISINGGSNKPVESQTSLANSLYTFILNGASRDKLEAKIKEYEQDLEYMSELISIYDAAGYDAMAEDAVIRSNKLREKILVLKLKANKLDREMLEFELEAIRRD
jgi:hypothetical protein